MCLTSTLFMVFHMCSHTYLVDTARLVPWTVRGLVGPERESELPDPHCRCGEPGPKVIDYLNSEPLCHPHDDRADCYGYCFACRLANLRELDMRIQSHNPASRPPRWFHPHMYKLEILANHLGTPMERSHIDDDAGASAPLPLVNDQHLLKPTKKGKKLKVAFADEPEVIPAAATADNVDETEPLVGADTMTFEWLRLNPCYLTTLQLAYWADDEKITTLMWIADLKLHGRSRKSDQRCADFADESVKVLANGGFEALEEIDDCEATVAEREKTIPSNQQLVPPFHDWEDCGYARIAARMPRSLKQFAPSPYPPFPNED